MKVLNLAACVCMLAIGASDAVAGTVPTTTILGFDELPATIGDSNATHAGDTYANFCLSISSSRSTPASALRVGGTVALTSIEDGFDTANNDGGQTAISDPNILIPRDGLFDVLMEFSDPVSSISLKTDQFNETPDTVYLYALTNPVVNATTGATEFTILAFDTSIDDATPSEGDNMMMLEAPAGTGFQYVFFQAGFDPSNPSTRELEGFDDLTFTKDPGIRFTDIDDVVPEPSTMVMSLLAVGGALLYGRRV